MQPSEQAPIPESGAFGAAADSGDPDGELQAAAGLAALHLREAAAKAAQAAAWVVGASQEAAKAAELLGVAVRGAAPLMAEGAEPEAASQAITFLARALKGASDTGMDLTVQARDAMVRAAHLGERCPWQPPGRGGFSRGPAGFGTGSPPEEARRRWSSAVLGISSKAPSGEEDEDLGGNGNGLLGDGGRRARPTPTVAVPRHPLKVLSRMTGCRLAEWRAERSLAQAERTGRKVRDTDVTFVLDAWKFRKNDKRKNVIPDGNTFVSSEMLGLVNVRVYRRLVVAQQSMKFPMVTKLLCQYLYDNPPAGLKKGVQFPFTTVCINKDYAAKRHRDNNNTGLSVVRALGNFKGGRLRYWPEDPGPREAPDVNKLDATDAMVLDVRGRSIALDSTKAHEVEPFEGRRYSLVYFTIPWVNQTDGKTRDCLMQRCGLEIKQWESSEDVWRSVKQPSLTSQGGGQAKPGSVDDFANHDED